MWLSFIFVGWALVKLTKANFHTIKKVNVENYQTIKEIHTFTVTECVLSCRNNKNCTEAIAKEGNGSRKIVCTLLKLKRTKNERKDEKTVIKSVKKKQKKDENDFEIITPISDQLVMDVDTKNHIQAECLLSKSCFDGSCPVFTGNWTTWSAWSQQCLHKCNGTLFRNRTCIGEKPQHGRLACKGNGIEYIICNGSRRCTVECSLTKGCFDGSYPVFTGNWTTWSAWSKKCSHKCNGTLFRNRTCIGEKPQHGRLACKGNGIEYIICNGSRRCTVEGLWTVGRCIKCIGLYSISLNGSITITKDNNILVNTLLPSDNQAIFPTSNGWFKIEMVEDWQYIKVAKDETLEIYHFCKSCTKSYKGLDDYFQNATGWRIDGTWITAYSNTNIWMYTITKQGAVIPKNSVDWTSTIMASDDQMRFPSSKGWFRGVNIGGRDAHDYRRLMEDGSIEIYHFCGQSRLCDGDYDGKNLYLGKFYGSRIGDVNLALRKPCYQSGRYYGAYPSRAVDGNMVLYSCTWSGDKRYWYVDLQKDVSIDAVVIFPYGNYQYTTLNVYVKSTTSSSWELCRKIENTIKRKTIIITCGSNNTGRYVKIERVEWGYLAFNEVEVYGKMA